MSTSPAKKTADLKALVAEGLITPSGAAAIRRQRARDNRRAAEREAKEAAWRARREESDRMAPTWALFVQAHGPEFGDSVIHSDLPLRHAVEMTQPFTDCTPLACHHLPLLRHDPTTEETR